MISRELQQYCFLAYGVSNVLSVPRLHLTPLAGAVASIAFGECEPLVDGNVIRVLSRLKAVASDPKNAGLNKLCW